MWTATLHAAKSLCGVSGSERNVSMGSLLHRDFGTDAFVLAFSAVSGTVRFKSAVKIQPLDFNGYPTGTPTTGTELKLAPKTVYYLVTR